MNHLRSDRPVPRRNLSGFTLIELMIAVAIIGILVGIALPSYISYVTRGKLVAMTNTLAGMRTAMEQFYQDNRTYQTVGTGATAITSPCDDTTHYVMSYGAYSVACSNVSGTTYTLTATATSGSTSGAAYTVDQSNAMATTSFPTSWGGASALPSNASTCWLMRKGDSC